MSLDHRFFDGFVRYQPWNQRNMLCVFCGWKGRRYAGAYICPRCKDGPLRANTGPKRRVRQSPQPPRRGK